MEEDSENDFVPDLPDEVGVLSLDLDDVEDLSFTLNLDEEDVTPVLDGLGDDDLS